jgi:hypothetical protein
MAILLAATGAALALALILLLSGGQAAQAKKARRPKRGHGRGKQLVPALPPRTCPLCGCELAPGERIKSDLTAGTGDRIMRIHGCPHCRPEVAGAKALPRRCPVCEAELPPGGYVVARYFESPGRKHVHVLGCTNCRPNS